MPPMMPSVPIPAVGQQPANEAVEEQVEEQPGAQATPAPEADFNAMFAGQPGLLELATTFQRLSKEGGLPEGVRLEMPPGSAAAAGVEGTPPMQNVPAAGAPPPEPGVTPPPTTDTSIAQSKVDQQVADAGMGSIDIAKILDFDVKDIFGEENRAVFDQLTAQATKTMSPHEIIALSGMAMANPVMAQTLMLQYEQGRQQAQQTLAGLAASAATFKRAALQEYLQAQQLFARTSAAYDKTELAAMGNLVRDRYDYLAKSGVVQVPPAPDQSNPEAMRTWMTQTQPLVGEATAVGNTVKEMMDFARFSGAADPVTMRRSFAARLKGMGVEPARINGYWAQYGEMFVENARAQNKIREDTSNRIQAITKEHEAREAHVRAQTDEIESKIESGSIKDIRAASLMLTDMLNYTQRAQGTLNSLRAQEMQWLNAPENLQGTEVQMYSLGEIRSTMAQIEADSQAFQPLVQSLAQRMLPHMSALDFSGTYSQSFNRALERTIGADPALAANPQQAFQSIVFGAPNDPIKQKFWQGLFTDIRTQFPDMTLRDVIDLLEEEAVSQAAGSGVMAPGAMESGALAPSGNPLSQSEEFQLWHNAGQAVTGAVKGGAATPPYQIPATGVRAAWQMIQRLASGAFGDAQSGMTGGAAAPPQQAPAPAGQQ